MITKEQLQDAADEISNCGPGDGFMCHTRTLWHRGEFTQLLNDHGVSRSGTLSYRNANRELREPFRNVSSTGYRGRAWRFDFLNLLAVSGVR